MESRTIDESGTTQAQEVVRDIYEALAGGDFAAFLGRLANNVEWTVAAGLPQGGVYIGPEAVAGLFAGYADVWDDFQVVPAQIYGAQHTVLALGHYRGTHRVTRKSVVARFAHVWHIEDGKAVRFETINDSHTIVAAG
ncbi:nuclear transport factor 2 family protein [Lentzea sp. NPDC051213]|uniref:nuclear transport factor 2 family protein n=1 Tax=Lentzea sp. NPDC051213 TaxID=3364126 RepID=UPI0037959B68